MYQPAYLIVFLGNWCREDLYISFLVINEKSAGLNEKLQSC